MLTQTLNKLFKRDLNKLKEEIKLYSNESNLWLIDKDVLNSAGNLCLHLVGNLNHFIGAEIGKTNYIRQRDLEFSLKNVPRAELIQQVDDVRPFGWCRICVNCVDSIFASALTGFLLQ